MVTLWLSIVLWHSPNPCRVVVLVIPYVVLIEKVTQLPVIYSGHGIEKERLLCLNV